MLAQPESGLSACRFWEIRRESITLGSPTSIYLLALSTPGSCTVSITDTDRDYGPTRGCQEILKSVYFVLFY